MIKKVKYQLQQLIENPLSVLLLLLYLAEGAYKLLVYNNMHDIRVSAGLKIVLQLYFLFHILKNTPKRLLLPLLLMVLFIVGQLILFPLEKFTANLLFLDKYLFVILALLYVNSLKNRQKYYSGFFNTFEKLILFNSVLIFIGLIMEVSVFETYRAPRFGFDGLLLRSGAATYIYWIALFYFAHQIFVLKRKKHLSGIVILLAAFLLGTKSMLLALGLLPIYFFVYFKWYRRKLVLFPLVVILITSFFWFSWVVDLYSQYSGTYQTVAENEGFATAFFSYRNVHLMEEMIPSIQEKWHWINYLFGGAVDMHFRSQFGFLDLFYFFGIIGSALFLYIFGKAFITFRLNVTTIFFMAVTCILIGFAANFFYETIIAMYLIVIKSYFEQRNLSN